MYGIGGETRPHRADARPPLRLRRRRVRCASATARTTSSSTTSGACCSTPSRAPAARRRRSPHAVWDGIAGLVDNAVAQLPRARPGHLGDARRAEALRRVEGDVLGRGSTAAPAWRSSATTTSAPSAWQKAADEIKAEVLRDAASTNAACSSSTTTPTTLDASLLLIPIMGFLPPDDERVRSDGARDRRRAHQGRPRAPLPGRSTDDGLSGEEGTFTICSFWLVSALALIGEVERARALFEKLLSFAGPLLLYAEEIDADERTAPRELPAGVHAPGADRRGHGADQTRRSRPKQESRRPPDGPSGTGAHSAQALGRSARVVRLRRATACGGAWRWRGRCARAAAVLRGRARDRHEGGEGGNSVNPKRQASVRVELTSETTG